MKTLLITGDRSGSGKTSITTAIAALLSKKYVVQTFKVGMDYIDPSYLTGVTGRPCRNLDTFVLSDEENREIFYHACQGADIAIIEGVRGLFEGADSIADIGSTASVAKLLGLPVILVIDSRSITRSAAALLHGFMTFDPGLRISGVILNNVRGEGHCRKATEAIEHFCKIPVIGAIPRFEALDLTMRHLGLVPFQEGDRDTGFLTRVHDIVQAIGDHLDLDSLLSLAKEVLVPPYSGSLFKPVSADCTIAVARDEAFNFYYADLFSLLPALGAQVSFFSPVHDSLPDADGYILGGGYPEYFGRELEENVPVREAVHDVSLAGIPVYAECGGLMYLCDSIRFGQDWQSLKKDESFQMCGVFPGIAEIPARRVVSYVIGTSSPGTPFGEHSFRGHEFHYSAVRFSGDVQFGFSLSRGRGIENGKDGVLSERTLGSYTHLHPVASASMFAGFVRSCKE